MHYSEIALGEKIPKKTYTVALLGNPNSGKSSVFNRLTGLRQSTGNFPGVTVEQKAGQIRLNETTHLNLIDFPGTYSLYPNSQDERIVLNTFFDPKGKNHPDLILYIADVTQLEKHLLLFTQLADLGLPMILALNMSDISEKKGMQVDVKGLESSLSYPVISISGRKGGELKELKEKIATELSTLTKPPSRKTFYKFPEGIKKLTREIMALTGISNPYRALLLAHHYNKLPSLEEKERDEIGNICSAFGFESLKAQVAETMKRYDVLNPLLSKSVRLKSDSDSGFTERIDRIITHRVFGPAIFFILMLLIFQAIFAWSTYPMDGIEWIFSALTGTMHEILPAGWLTNLLTDGILAGLGGILIFIPQIAILFLLIAILEEIGYMARAVFMFDNIMQKFGLNGRSIVALVSGGACAIPAIMTTRTISNWKERLTTIMVTPLISCSARIPVYAILIALVIPSQVVFGVFNIQGLAFMGLYLLGIVFALISAFVFKIILKSDEQSFLLLELPRYKTPEFRNVIVTVLDKVKTFVFEAGKVILVISIILWGLASYGPQSKMDAAKLEAITLAETQNLDELSAANLLASKQIEASYAGHLGKWIEPAIRPLGFDWKIGIALITSFAAREVFVGTMATIYSVGSADNESTIRMKMAKETRSDTGEPVYSFATAMSLLIFYVFALQCMSTLAIVRRETNSWKWPFIQFLYMGILAYLGSLLVYQMLS